MSWQTGDKWFLRLEIATGIGREEAESSSAEEVMCRFEMDLSAHGEEG